MSTYAAFFKACLYLWDKKTKMVWSSVRIGKEGCGMRFWNPYEKMKHSEH